MNTSTSLVCEFELHSPLSDIAAHFADSPTFRISADIKHSDIDILHEAFRDRVFRSHRSAGPEKLHWDSLLLKFGPSTFALALGEGRDSLLIVAAQEDDALAVYREISGKLNQAASLQNAFFYMLRYDCGYFYTERVEELPEDPGDEFLELCYGGDVDGWFDEFSRRTQERPGGITILEGAPGTGKTSFVSVMMQRLTATHVFYALPVAQADGLSSPELVPFWQSQNRKHADRVKVIVIEDAERLLWPRSADNREAVSSILNIADGLIGRMLRLHILCSVNARLNDLDPAIMRPGRLTNQRSFPRLTRQAARRIAEMRSLSFDADDDREDFALAEILNPGSRPVAVRRAIGFSR